MVQACRQLVVKRKVREGDRGNEGKTRGKQRHEKRHGRGPKKKGDLARNVKIEKDQTMGCKRGGKKEGKVVGWESDRKRIELHKSLQG